MDNSFAWEDPANSPFGFCTWKDLYDTYSWWVSDNLSKVGFVPTVHSRRIQETFGAWKNDVDRNGEKNFESGEARRPDHIKCAALLSYWLRRMMPATDIHTDKDFLKNVRRLAEPFTPYSEQANVLNELDCVEGSEAKDALQQLLKSPAAPSADQLPSLEKGIGSGDSESYTPVPMEEWKSLDLTYKGQNIELVLRQRAIYIKYLNERIAFSFAYSLAASYEAHSREYATEYDGDDPAIRWKNAKIFVPTQSFVEETCYFMKYKNVSPHAMYLIFKALLRRV